MDVLIENVMGEPVHVAVVRHSRVSLQFVIGPDHMPVPTGRIVERHDVEDGQALSLTGLDDDTCCSACFEGFAGRVRATLASGTADGRPFYRLTLLHHARGT